MPPDSTRWLFFAAEDLRMAQLARDAGISNQVCFHAQQCCEKLLKGLLAAGNTIPPRTHKMADLLPLFHDDLPPELKTALRLLDRFYIPARYPDALPGSIESGLPSDSDAEEAWQTANDFTAYVQSHSAQ